MEQENLVPSPPRAKAVRTTGNRSDSRRLTTSIFGRDPVGMQIPKKCSSATRTLITVTGIYDS